MMPANTHCVEFYYRDEWIPLFPDIRILGYHSYLNIMDTWIVGYQQSYDSFGYQGLMTLGFNDAANTHCVELYPLYASVN